MSEGGMDMPFRVNTGRLFHATAMDRPMTRGFKTTVIFMLILYGMGIIMGALACAALPKSVLIQVTHQVLVQLQTFPWSPVTLNITPAFAAALVSVGLVLLFWLLGQSAVGSPFIIGLLFLRGAILGCGLVFGILALGFHGALFDLLAVMPWNILTAGGIVLAASASHMMTQPLRSMGLSQVPKNAYIAFCTLHVLSAILCLTSGWIETILVPRIWALVG